MKKLYSLLMAALVLASCATTPPAPPTPLPYRFTLADISDARLTPEQGGTDPLYDMLPFDSRAVGMAFMSNLVASTFNPREAQLHLKITHYEATTNDGGYALSMAMEGYALDDSSQPQTVGQFNATCSSVQREHFALDAFATESWQQKSLRPLTPEGRDTRMWRAALNECTTELARQFSMALVAKGD